MEATPERQRKLLMNSCHQKRLMMEMTQRRAATIWPLESWVLKAYANGMGVLILGPNTTKSEVRAGAVHPKTFSCRLV